MKKKLRIIISSCGSITKINVVQKILAHFLPTYSTIVYIKNKFRLKKNLYVQWLNFYDLIYAKYPIEWASCIPLDDPLLRKLAYCETLVLQMMNRLDWDETIPYIARKEMYLNHVRFWNNEMISKKINIVVFLGIPHEIYDFVLYSLCKTYNIPTIILESGRHRDTTLLFHDYENSMEKLFDKYNHLLTQPSIHPIVSKKFQRKLNDISYLKMPLVEVVKWRSYEICSYIMDVLSVIISNPKKIILNLINPLFLIHRLKSITKKQLMKLYYWKLSQIPDITQKYIFVALHYQPECTTSPLGGVYVNQELMIHMLHQVTPSDVLIYVKEHPLPSYTMRSFSFYKSLLISPRVRLIRTYEDSNTLIEHSLAVATVTGTVGWEAIARGKPILMFGHEYYQFAPGVFQISSIQECRNAVEQIIHHKYSLSLQDLNLFHQAMEETMIDGYIDELFKPQSYLSVQVNIKHLTKALIEEIKKIF